MQYSRDAVGRFSSAGDIATRNKSKALTRKQRNVMRGKKSAKRVSAITGSTNGVAVDTVRRSADIRYHSKKGK
jgi:hypothetical protein